MKTLLAFVLLAFNCSAQLVPKITVTVELPTLKAATDERTRQAEAIALVKSKTDPLDEAPKVSVSPGSRRPVVITSTLYAGKPALLAAQEFIRTNVWPAGSVITIERHLCPHSNAVPAGWLGCANDPRAENARTVLKP